MAFAVSATPLYRLLREPSNTHKGEPVDTLTTESSMSTASQLTRFAILGATRKRVADIFSLLFLAASILILSLTTSAFAQAGAPISGQWITP